MCLKTCFILLFLTFMHAYSTITPTSIPRPTKIDEKFKFKKHSPNGRRQHTFGFGDIIAHHTTNPAGCSEDCTSSTLPKTLQHVTQSKGSRWAHENIVGGGMDVETTILREQDLSETDYQPPHRKSPIHNK